MIQAQRALVKPRVIAPDTGGATPLEDLVQSLVESGTVSALELTGSPGSGKTTALCHLKAILPPNSPVLLFDELGVSEVRALRCDRLVVYTSKVITDFTKGQAFALSPWGRDEAIEYLLAAYPDRCQSVMARLLNVGDECLDDGSPELWRIVLDELASDESLPSPRAALRRHFDWLFSDPNLQDLKKRCEVRKSSA